jgi:hypothetical protein
LGRWIRAASHHSDCLQGTGLGTYATANTHIWIGIGELVRSFLFKDFVGTCKRGKTDTLVAFLRSACPIIHHGHRLWHYYSPRSLSFAPPPITSVGSKLPRHRGQHLGGRRSTIQFSYPLAARFSASDTSFSAPNAARGTAEIGGSRSCQTGDRPAWLSAPGLVTRWLVRIATADGPSAREPIDYPGQTRCSLGSRITRQASEPCRHWQSPCRCSRPRTRTE